MESWLIWTTIAANIVTALGIAVFAIYYFSHRQNQRHFGFTVMISCIERFQQLLPKLSINKEVNETIKKYVDLTNEEFFYFQNGYIPKAVMVEWLDSIIENFPIYSNLESSPINLDYLSYKEIHESNILERYPRLKKALTVSGGYSPQLIFGNRSIKGYREERKRLIVEISKNLGITLHSKHFKKAMMI